MIVRTLTALVAASLLVGCTSISVGSKAPNFAATTISGDDVSLEDGHVMILDFWAVW